MLLVGFSGCKAFAAVNSLAFGRIEGHFAFFAAFSANSVEHFSCSLDCVLASIAAGLASLGFVLEALFCVEFLFTCSEHEILATILALQCFVLIHVFLPR